MMRKFVFVIFGVILGVFGWFLLTTVNHRNVIKVAEIHASVVVIETLKPTPFQPQTNTSTSTNSTTPTSTPHPSKTPTASQTITTKPTLTSSATPTPLPTPTPTITSTLLDEAFIEGIKGRWPAYSLDCEARSAVDWAAFFGYEIDEIEFFSALPTSDNPDIGFVGDVNDSWGQTPPDSYGIHAEPIAELLRSYGLNTQARKGLSYDELRVELSKGRPVIVWVVGRVGRGTPEVYISAEGEEITVARFEHTVILIGYTPSEVTVLDGYWLYSRQVGDFLSSWGVLGNMAVILGQE